MAHLGDNVDHKWHTTRKVMHNSNLICAFLQGKTCKIYEDRPKLCKIYPFLAISANDLVSFGVKVPDEAICLVGEDKEKYYIIYDEACPGIGKGQACNWPEIVALSISHFRDFIQSK
jgi:Fe-S-cluster containining protein